MSAHSQEGILANAAATKNTEIVVDNVWLISTTPTATSVPSCLGLASQGHRDRCPLGPPGNRAKAQAQIVPENLRAVSSIFDNHHAFGDATCEGNHHNKLHSAKYAMPSALFRLDSSMSDSRGKCSEILADMCIYASRVVLQSPTPCREEVVIG